MPHVFRGVDGRTRKIWVLQDEEARKILEMDRTRWGSRVHPVVVFLSTRLLGVSGQLNYLVPKRVPSISGQKIPFHVKFSLFVVMV